jgi:anti-anti-sigma factor
VELQLPPRFALDVVADRDSVTLHVFGELDSATVPELRRAVGELWQSGWTDAAVDVGRVDFIDSTGLAALLWLCHAAHADGRRLEIAGSCPSLERLIEVAGLENALPRT